MSKETSYFQMDDLRFRHDLQEISQELSGLDGIVSVSSSPYDPKVAIRYESGKSLREEIENHMSELGYYAVGGKTPPV